MRFKNLASLKRPAAGEIILATLPEKIFLSRYASDKAFKINELVRTLYQDSYEWYGFTIGTRDNPELISDLGLPRNNENIQQYTRVEAEMISGYQDELPPHLIITGWIHSHGSMDFKGFSSTDAANHLTVLDYVTARSKKPLAKREILVQNLALLVQEDFSPRDLEKGNVCLVTDAPVTAAQIWETVYGGFCYSIVIGDAGWHHQEIYYKTRGILSGETRVSHQEAELVLVDTGRTLTELDITALSEEVKEKIQPQTYTLAKLESV
ncbi:MAG: hypothetical protein AB1491_09325 [Thermodesulfobacteriota bacterium]